MVKEDERNLKVRAKAPLKGSFHRPSPRRGGGTRAVVIRESTIPVIGRLSSASATWKYS